MTSHWTAEQLSRIGTTDICHAPVIAAPRRLIDDMDLWDYWPVQEEDGTPAIIAGGTLYMLLSAPRLPDPDARHAIARIRLMHCVGQEWRDLGFLFDAGFSPGSREWSGSAIIAPDHSEVTLYFTAAGARGEPEISFGQRLFETRAKLELTGDRPGFSRWSEPREMLVPDGLHYVRDMAGGGAIGTIKAFRDPAYFRDPADGSEYMVFSASLAQSASPWNGAVGIARRKADGGWQSMPPLLDADELNNELERPHVVVHDGRYYLFWSTQQKVFASGGPTGPNGLYAMVADRLLGPWLPVNDSGLVFANPSQAPFQAYSWLVLPDLTVHSFADMIGLSHPPCDAKQARVHFGGTPAPELRLSIRGERAWLA